MTVGMISPRCFLGVYKGQDTSFHVNRASRWYRSCDAEDKMGLEIKAVSTQTLTQVCRGCRSKRVNLAAAGSDTGAGKGGGKVVVVVMISTSEI